MKLGGKKRKPVVRLVCNSAEQHRGSSENKNRRREMILQLRRDSLEADSASDDASHAPCVTRFFEALLLLYYKNRHRRIPVQTAARRASGIPSLPQGAKAINITRAWSWTSGKCDPGDPAIESHTWTRSSTLFCQMRERGSGMDRVFVDEETGEDLIHPFYDCVARPIDSTTTVNDAETGEPEVTHVDHTTFQTRHRRVPFQIPKEVKEKSSKKRHHMELEPVPAGASFGQINPVCLFLPAIMYFRWFVALLMIFEVVFHVWAHHKNKALKNTNVYFRSPFHDISAEFCALCQNETCMNRVGKLHQIRMHKFLRQCNYMKRVVT